MLRQTVSQPVCLGAKHPYNSQRTIDSLLNLGTDRAENTASQLLHSSMLRSCCLTTGILQSRSLETAASVGFTVLALCKYAIELTRQEYGLQSTSPFRVTSLLDSFGIFTLRFSVTSTVKANLPQRLTRRRMREGLIMFHVIITFAIIS